MESKYSLKDELFNRETVQELGTAIKSVYPSFELDDFVENCLIGFPELELKERMSLVCECLTHALASDYFQVTDIMLQASKVTMSKESFVYGAFSEYVETHGCSDDLLEHSLQMLGEYTKIFSAEFAIRAFINKFPEETLCKMKQWAQSENVDQRRLASEGLRPKLPWGKKITMDPEKAMETLEYLFYDDDRYVTRSVANHLNDISKINPNLVISTLERWKASKKQNDAEMNYIVNHSTRSLIKQGNQEALALQGYLPVDLSIHDFVVLTEDIVIGDSLSFTFKVEVAQDTKLMIDYIVDYPMAKGKRSRKVFKIKKASVKKNEALTVTKNHPFRLMTTKKLYSGVYYLSLQINGKTYEKRTFTLNADI